jgi:RNA polymerase sigma-70 factor (ECF subfamily)
MTAIPQAPDYDGMILAIAERRDRAAFTALFGYFAPRVKAYLQRADVGAAVMDDMVQEVLLTVWHKAAQFDPARANAHAWIFGIARNLRIDVLRRSRFVIPDNSPAEETPIPLSDALVAAKESARALRIAIDTLPPEQALMLQMAFYEDISHAEIGRRLAVPLGTVKSRLRRAIEKLRFALKEAP